MKKAGDIIASNVSAGSTVKEIYAKTVRIKKKIILKKIKNVDLAIYIYNFLPSLEQYCDTIKKYIRSYIIDKKVKKWGRGIFIDTFVDADWYFYIPAFDCNLWKTYQINQDKYVEHCSVCNKKFNLGPHQMNIQGVYAGVDEFEMIDSYCYKCWDEPENYFNSPHYKLTYTEKKWTWPQTDIQKQHVKTALEP